MRWEDCGSPDVRQRLQVWRLRDVGKAENRACRRVICSGRKVNWQSPGGGQVVAHVSGTSVKIIEVYSVHEGGQIVVIL